MSEFVDQKGVAVIRLGREYVEVWWVADDFEKQAIQEKVLWDKETLDRIFSLVVFQTGGKPVRILWEQDLCEVAELYWDGDGSNRSAVEQIVEEKLSYFAKEQRWDYVVKKDELGNTKLYVFLPDKDVWKAFVHAVEDSGLQIVLGEPTLCASERNIDEVLGLAMRKVMTSRIGGFEVLASKKRKKSGSVKRSSLGGNALWFDQRRSMLMATAGLLGLLLVVGISVPLVQQPTRETSQAEEIEQLVVENLSAVLLFDPGLEQEALQLQEALSEVRVQHVELLEDSNSEAKREVVVARDVSDQSFKILKGLFEERGFEVLRADGLDPFDVVIVLGK